VDFQRFLLKYEIVETKSNEKITNRSRVKRHRPPRPCAGNDFIAIYIIVWHDDSHSGARAASKGGRAVGLLRGGMKAQF
jgi:hypothetical protein